MPPSADVLTHATRTVQNSHPALRKVLIERAAEALIISGTVTCYYHKQLAQEALKPFRGGLELLNHIEVDAN